MHILLARSRRGCCKKIKNKTWQTRGFGAYAGNEGMGGQRRSNTQKTHNALYFQLSTSLSFDLYCPVDIEAVKVSSKIGKMLKKPVPEVVLDLYYRLQASAAARFFLTKSPPQKKSPQKYSENSRSSNRGVVTPPGEGIKRSPIHPLEGSCLGYHLTP